MFTFFNRCSNFDSRTVEPLTTPTRDVAAFKRAVGHFPTGLTIVTAHHGAIPVGMTLQSFMSLSLDPMLIALAVARTSTTWPLIEPTGAFAVNILAGHHHNLARRFAVHPEKRFEAVEYSTSRAGNPVFTDSVAWLDCRTHRIVDGGDHWIVMADVIEIGGAPDGAAEPALVFFRSRFHHTTTPHPEEGTP